MPTTTDVKSGLRRATLALTFTTGIAMLGAAAPAQATGFTVGSHIKATSALLTQVGAPVAAEVQVTASAQTGWSQAFERGTLYASSHGTWPVLARDKAAFDGRSGLDGVGWPMGMPTSTTGHGITGTTQSFSGNSTLRETARILVHNNKSAVVKGHPYVEVRDKGLNFTGWPLANEFYVYEGGSVGWQQKFTRGFVALRKGTPTAFHVQGMLHERFLAKGGVAVNGWPTGNYRWLARCNYWVQDFTKALQFGEDDRVCAAEQTYYVANMYRPVNIRSGAGMQFAVVGTFAAKATVVGVEAGDWVKTSRGYVHLGTLTTSADLSALNGTIPLSALCAVPKSYNGDNTFDPGYTPQTQRYLNCFALKQLDLLQGAFRAHFGGYARIDLTYRPLAEQWYWFNKFGSPRAATPGTSPHGFGISIDFQENDGWSTFDWGQPGNRWLLANSKKYGFGNPFPCGTWGELYHFDFQG
ncbi:hypothetical protein IEE94_09210 [Yimella sp. cx-573]|nr:hypothetical protein [Yimella sp. cx-573]